MSNLKHFGTIDNSSQRSSYAQFAERDTDELSSGVFLKAPAKINLSLIVSAPRPDGYHDIHTVMATIDLFDEIGVTHAQEKGIHLYCTGLKLPGGASNIVYRAGQRLAQYANISPAINIHLKKNIPLGSGLGGGSSDAAACLIALNKLWNLNLTIEQLANIAAKLGSDVPFFFFTPVALCTGRGENIEPLTYRLERHILLITPAICVPTAQIYRNYSYDRDKTDKQLQEVNDFLDNGDLEGLILQGVNSLTDTSFQQFKELQGLVSKFKKMGIAPLFMSGSGSAFFACADSQKQVLHWEQIVTNSKLAKCRAVRFLQQNGHCPEVHHADF